MSNREQVINDLQTQIEELKERLTIALDGQSEIVRCKNCKHGKSRKNAEGEDMIDCLLADNWLKHPDWFCADGERKEVK